MRFAIKPKKGAGPIEYGMKVDQVRSLIRSSPHSFKRTPLSEHPLDHFESEGVFVEYDATGSVKALEFDDSADLSLDGRSIQNLTARDVRQLAHDSGLACLEDRDGMTLHELGISFWFPFKEDPASTAESILVFRDGYFDGEQPESEVPTA